MLFKKRRKGKHGKNIHCVLRTNNISVLKKKLVYNALLYIYIYI